MSDTFSKMRSRSDGEHVTPARASIERGPGPWWVAHEYPERPPDQWCLWAWTCDACVMHLVAASITKPNDIVTMHEPFNVNVVTTFTSALETVRTYRKREGMMPL